MDAILIMLGALGLGAIIISAYVFVVAARNYVSDDYNSLREPSMPHPAARAHIVRNPEDRRSGKRVEFPLTVNGVVIAKDRRQRSDRRSAA